MIWFRFWITLRFWLKCNWIDFYDSLKSAIAYRMHVGRPQWDCAWFGFVAFHSANWFTVYEFWKQLVQLRWTWNALKFDFVDGDWNMLQWPLSKLTWFERIGSEAEKRSFMKTLTTDSMKIKKNFLRRWMLFSHTHFFSSTDKSQTVSIFWFYVYILMQWKTWNRFLKLNTLFVTISTSWNSKWIVHKMYSFLSKYVKLLFSWHSVKSIALPSFSVQFE